MSFRNTVRVSKLQSKNKMIGKTFNIGGHTMDSLDKRDNDYLINFNNLIKKDKIKEIKQLKELVKVCEKKGWSFPFSYNLLKIKGLL